MQRPTYKPAYLPELRPDYDVNQLRQSETPEERLARLQARAGSYSSGVYGADGGLLSQHLLDRIKALEGRVSDSPTGTWPRYSNPGVPVGRGTGASDDPFTGTGGGLQSSITPYQPPMKPISEFPNTGGLQSTLTPYTGGLQSTITPYYNPNDPTGQPPVNRPPVEPPLKSTGPTWALLGYGGKLRV